MSFCRIATPSACDHYNDRVNVLQERLPPSAAAAKLNDRVKKIGKVNSEIADWLQVSFYPGDRSIMQDAEQPVGTSQDRKCICRRSQEIGSATSTRSW